MRLTGLQPSTQWKCGDAAALWSDQQSNIFMPLVQPRGSKQRVRKLGEEEEKARYFLVFGTQ